MFRNATNFGEKKKKTKPLIKALSVVKMEFSLKCLRKLPRLSRDPYQSVTG